MRRELHDVQDISVFQVLDRNAPAHHLHHRSQQHERVKCQTQQRPAAPASLIHPLAELCGLTGPLCRRWHPRVSWSCRARDCAPTINDLLALPHLPTRSPTWRVPRRLYRAGAGAHAQAGRLDQPSHNPTPCCLTPSINALAEPWDGPIIALTLAEPRDGPIMLALAPMRELAVQIQQECALTV